jgi:hypothetical protein
MEMNRDFAITPVLIMAMISHVKIRKSKINEDKIKSTKGEPTKNEDNFIKSETA